MNPVAAARDLERPAVLFGPFDGAVAAARQPAPSGPTLQDVVTGAWGQLARRAETVCPLCRGTMRARWGAGPSPVAGRCDDCATELS